MLNFDNMINLYFFNRFIFSQVLICIFAASLTFFIQSAGSSSKFISVLISYHLFVWLDRQKSSEKKKKQTDVSTNLSGSHLLSQVKVFVSR